MNGDNETVICETGRGDHDREEEAQPSIQQESFDLEKIKKEVTNSIWPTVNRVATAFTFTISTVCESLIGSGDQCSSSMAMRSRKPCEPLGPVYLLRSVRDQVALFQERRGVTPEENNFVNLLAIMLTQTGQAMYGVFTMFLSLLPAAVMFLHIAHFILDRILDLVTTRKKNELIIKSSIFSIQTVAIFFLVKFVVASIFLPIFYMQTSIISKIFMMDSAPVVPPCGK